MASPSTPVHPARYLAFFLALLVGVYLLVFLTGDKQAKPKLGIDLQGGTRVTLTARTPDGSAPTRDALNQAQQIISARVNGLGVSGSEVIIDGSNLVITVPGNDSSEARNLGQTARLYIRPVIQAYPAQPAGQAGQPANRGAPQRACDTAGGATAASLRHRARGSARRARDRAGKPCGATRRASSAAAPPVPAGSATDPGAPRAADAGPGATASPTHGKTSRSASPTRRRGGRAPKGRSSSWRCRSRPRSATRTTSWQATTIRTCRW